MEMVGVGARAGRWNRGPIGVGRLHEGDGLT